MSTSTSTWLTAQEDTDVAEADTWCSTVCAGFAVVRQPTKAKETQADQLVVDLEVSDEIVGFRVLADDRIALLTATKLYILLLQA